MNVFKLTPEIYVILWGRLHPADGSLLYADKYFEKRNQISPVPIIYCIFAFRYLTTSEYPFSAACMTA